MKRSDIRYALFRVQKNNAEEEHQKIYEQIAKQLSANQTIDRFSIDWDIYTDGNTVYIIKPEIDYDFIHSTCLERSICEKNGVQMHPNRRQMNIIQIVELHMLEGKMSWLNYNSDWTVLVDRELKKIETRLAKTRINRVTDEMIQNSAKSDGAPMTKIPELPKVILDDPTPMSEEEIQKFKSFLGRKD